MVDRIEFDWDENNKSHLAAHQVTASEFEQVVKNEPLDLDYEVVGGEERYRSVGVTDAGRCLTIAWTIRRGKIRPITAFSASAGEKKAFLKRPKT